MEPKKSQGRIAFAKLGEKIISGGKNKGKVEGNNVLFGARLKGGKSCACA